nr:MAG: hypothetical protein [Microvirus sp.]
MNQVIKVLKIIIGLLPYLSDLIEFLEAIKKIRKESGDEVAKVITSDAASIAKNWKQYLDNTRGKEVQ